MDLLFRLESLEDGKGPYHSCTVSLYDSNQNYQSELHPAPRRVDGIDFEKGVDIFGFQNLSLCRRWWFDVDDLKDWTEAGMRLLVWPAANSERIKCGKTQCAMIRPRGAPLQLPCEALHSLTKASIEVMVKDKFGL